MDANRRHPKTLKVNSGQRSSLVSQLFSRAVTTFSGCQPHFLFRVKSSQSMPWVGNRYYAPKVGAKRRPTLTTKLKAKVRAGKAYQANQITRQRVAKSKLATLRRAGALQITARRW